MLSTKGFDALDLIKIERLDGLPRQELEVI